MHVTPKNKIYFGITSAKNPENRWGKHGEGYKTQQLFWRAIQKYGWDNIQHLVLLDNLSKEWACKLEQDFIWRYKSNDPEYGYNIAAGGNGCTGYTFSKEQIENRRQKMLGHPVSPETRKKIGDANKIALKGKTLSEETKHKLSIALSGENHPMYGKHQPRDAVERMRQKQLGNKYHLGYKNSEESCKRMSDAHKGLPLTESQLANLIKIHENNRGKPRSLEVRQKISASKLGKKRGPWTENERKAHMEANERRRKAKLQNTNS